MLNCNEIELDLSAYRDGALPPPDRANVETHLADCASCKASLAAIEKARASLKALPKIKSPASLKSKIRDQINAAPKVATPLRPVVRVDQIRNIPWAWACGMAAALAVSLMGYVTFFRPPSDTTTPPDELAFKFKAPAAPSVGEAKESKKDMPEIRKNDEQLLRKSAEALQQVDRLEENSKADKPIETAKAAAPFPVPTEKRALAQDRSAGPEKAASGFVEKQQLAGATPVPPAQDAAKGTDKSRFGGGAGPGEGGEPRRRQVDTDAAPKGADKPGTAAQKKSAAPFAPPAPKPQAALQAPVAGAAAPSKALKDGVGSPGQGENAINGLNRAAANAQEAAAKNTEQAQNLGAARTERKYAESDKKKDAPLKDKDIAGTDQFKNLADEKPAAAKSAAAVEKLKPEIAPPKPPASPPPAPGASGGANDGSANGRGARKDPLNTQRELRDEAEKLVKGRLREKAPQTIILHTSDVAALREKIKILADAKNAVIVADANAPTDKEPEKAEKADAAGTNLSITVDAGSLDALLTSLNALQNATARKEAGDPAGAAPATNPVQADAAKDGKLAADLKVTVRIEIVLDK